MFPGTVYTRFRPRSPHVPTPVIAASDRLVMLATEYSKPVATNASTAHHSTTSLAVSLAARVAIQSARHTSALQRTARRKSCPPARLVEPAASDSSARSSVVPEPGRAPVVSTPEASTKPASATDPTKLPARDAAHTRTTSTKVTRRANSPCSITIVLPVNSSAPANTTSTRAMPNTEPWTSDVNGWASATNGALTTRSSTTATPTYAPARSALRR